MTQHPIVKYQKGTKEKREIGYLCLKIDIYPETRVKSKALNQKEGAITAEYMFFSLNGAGSVF